MNRCISILTLSLLIAGCNGSSTKKEPGPAEQASQNPPAARNAPNESTAQEPPAAQPPPATAPARLSDPNEILSRADATLRAVKFVRYQIEYYAADAAKPTVSAQVVLGGKTTGRPTRYRIDVTLHEERERRLSLGSDGQDAHFLIDHDTRMVHAGNLRALGPHHTVFNTVTIREFIHPEPLADELAGQERVLRRITKVGDEDCYEIFVKYQPLADTPPQTATWFLSVNDWLPRRLDRTPGIAGNQRQVIYNIQVDPNFDRNPFAAVAPEGYQTTTEPAP